MRPGGVIKAICLCLALVCSSAAQMQAQTAEPPYVNSFYTLDATGRILPLERETATFHARTKALPGYASVKVLAQLKPGRSAVRVEGNAAQFFVRGRAPVDPSTRYELRALKRSKDHREFVMNRGHGTLVGGAAASSLDEGTIPIRIQEYGESSYRITPAQALAAGEYALALRGVVAELYCFGVD